MNFIMKYKAWIQLLNFLMRTKIQKEVNRVIEKIKMGQIKKKVKVIMLIIYILSDESLL
jgi:hypothetical protein